ncbi:MAG: hypothetical protein Kow00123_12090 [Anaerolineales bacterium]
MTTVRNRLQRLERATAKRAQRERVKAVLFMPLDGDLVRREDTGEVMAEGDFARRYPDAIRLDWGEDAPLDTGAGGV